MAEYESLQQTDAGMAARLPWDDAEGWRAHLAGNPAVVWSHLVDADTGAVVGSYVRSPRPVLPADAMAKPAPCPFCGGVDLRSYQDVTGDYVPFFYLICNGCGANGPDRPNPTRGSAVAAWNRRAPSPNHAHLRALVRDALDAVGGLRDACPELAAAVEGAEPTKGDRPCP